MDVVSLPALVEERIAAAIAGDCPAIQPARHDLAAIEDSVVLLSVINSDRA